MTKRQAEREKDKILREVNNQAYTIQSQIPFSAFVDKWREAHYPTLAVPTRNNYEQQLKTHILPALGRLRLCQIGPLECQSLFLALERAGIAKTTRNVIRGIVSKIFKDAKQWRFLETPNPVEGISAGGGPKRVRDTRRIPSIQDVHRLMEAVEPPIDLLIETLVSTGMRISEAAGLRWCDMRLDDGYCRVSRRQCRGDVGQTKSESGERNLPLGHLAEIFRKRRGDAMDDDYVFMWQGGPLRDNALLANYLTPRMVKLSIKFPGFGWHTFRRLHLTHMRNRLSVFDLRTQAGHADVRTTQLYVADDLSERDRAVRDLQAEVRGLKLVKGA